MRVGPMAWVQCHGDDARECFAARAKEYQEGNIIDLICDCRRIKGDDCKIGMPKFNNPIDCNGYTLKKYIEFLAEKPKS